MPEKGLNFPCKAKKRSQKYVVEDIFGVFGVDMLKKSKKITDK